MHLLIDLSLVPHPLEYQKHLLLYRWAQTKDPDFLKPVNVLYALYIFLSHSFCVNSKINSKYNYFKIIIIVIIS
jgi:hypothetical protein